MSKYPYLALPSPILAIALMVCLATLMSCDDDYISGSPRRLVVEGWIDEGDFPVVLLTKTVPISRDYERLNALDQYMVKWAKVTIDDGSQEVVLTGQPNAGYTPPYIYTTGRMRGEAGKTYNIRVEYRDYEATGSAQIPPHAEIDSFAVETSPVSDTLYLLKAYFTVPVEGGWHYKIFSNVNTPSGMFLTPPQGLVNGRLANGRVEVPVYRGQNVRDTDYTPYFLRTDTVSIKFCAIDDDTYRSWELYEQTVNFSRSPLFASTFNLPCNLAGALGTWFGYGASFYNITIADLLNENGVPAE